MKSPALLLLLFLAGCSVGPPYKPPVPTTPPAYKEPPPESFKQAAQAGWKPAQPGDQAKRGAWWEIFADPQLSGLAEQIVAGNETLKVLEARFRQARTLIQFNNADRYPTIRVGPSISGLRVSSHRPNIPGNPSATADLLLPFDLNYELDLWGRIRQSITAAREDAQASAGDLAAARLSLQAELALDYFELRSADAQQQLLEETVQAYESSLQLAKNRFEGGVASRAEVAQAQTQLEATRVALTDVAVRRAQFEHAIAVLTGKPPASLTIARSPLTLKPPPIPPGLPSELLERRPDIAAAERRAASANEHIGIARTAFYPTVRFGATAGVEGTSLTNWLSWPSRLWAVGPSMLQTLFDAGRRQAASDAALAAYDGAIAAYRETALAAFQEVEDSLAALRILDTEARQQQNAIKSAEESLELFTNRYKGGVDNYLQVVTAQTVALNNRRNAVDILRRQMDSSVLLIKALGGGWSAADQPKLDEPIKIGRSLPKPSPQRP